MKLINIFWSVTSVVAPILIGIALSLASDNLITNDYKIAYWCIVLSGVLLSINTIIWFITTKRKIWWHWFALVTVAFLVLVGEPLGLGWLDSRYSYEQQKSLNQESSNVTNQITEQVTSGSGSPAITNVQGNVSIQIMQSERDKH